jgi:hypothetical protein
MRTTLDLEDSLVRQAKRRAVKEGRTLTALLEDALRRYLSPRQRSGRRFRLKLLKKKGRLTSGVDLSDRDALYERMEGRS